MNKDEINSLINNFILKNPQVIEKTLQNLNLERSKKNFEIALNELRKIPNPKLTNTNSDVTIYEFFDYNCGYCKRVFGPIQEVLAEDDDIRVVIKEFPILSQSSLVAAQAAIATQKQGVFPNYHVTMMTNPGAISMDTILAAARNAGADVDRLQRDMRSDETAAVINRTRMSAEQLKISGTPGLIIGSTIIPGAISGEELRRLIAEERARRG